MPNGIDLILADHRVVDELFAAFAQTSAGPVAGQLIDALTAHDDAEHAALYPLALDVLGDASTVERWEAAHAAVKKQLDHVKAQEGAALVDAVDALRALVEEHVADEEKHLLPALSEKATTQQLDALGARILQAKQRGG
jgi:hypothetical protein